MRQSIQFFAHSHTLVNPHIFHHAPLDLSRISISPTESNKSAGLTNQPTHQQLKWLSSVLMKWYFIVSGYHTSD